MLKNVSKETKESLTVFGIVFSVGLGTFFLTLTLLSLGDFIRDSIGYDRYKEAMDRYQNCSSKINDELLVPIYCGEVPSVDSF